MTTSNVRFLFLSTFVMFFGNASTGIAADVIGQVAYANVFKLNVGVSGEIRKVNVARGDHVKAGTVLLELNNHYLQAQLEAASARLNFHRAHMEEMRRTYERDQILFDEGSLSTVELALSNIARLKSVANFKQSGAVLAESKLRLGLSLITAPVDGIVLERHVETGERIFLENRSTPAFLFAAPHKVITAEINANEATALRSGNPIDIRFGDQSLKGKLKSIIPTSEAGVTQLVIEANQPLPEVGHSVTISY